MSFNPEFNNIAVSFIQHYYEQFDTKSGAERAEFVAPLYDTENSFMTFEGVQCKGREAIKQKIAGLTFQRIQRQITCYDAQPLYDGSVFVSILGQLKTDDDPVNPFSHTFILRPGNNSFFIGNEVFRLVLHNA